SSRVTQQPHSPFAQIVDACTQHSQQWRASLVADRPCPSGNNCFLALSTSTPCGFGRFVKLTRQGGGGVVNWYAACISPIPRGKYNTITHLEESKHVRTANQQSTR